MVNFSSDIFSDQNFITTVINLQCKIIIITDNIIYDLYKSNLTKLKLIIIPTGEHNKTRKTKEYIENKMLRHSCARDTVIIALGGGVVLDLAGFVASTYCRGIKAIYIPTTLLAMVDATIGGKTAVNTKYGKNLIGTFYEPYKVFIDLNFLNTLSHEQIKNGLVECIKHGIIFDRAYFNFIKNNKDNFSMYLIKRSCEIKADIIKDDLLDNNKRNILNFGHTIGHAIEAASNFNILHGFAVALGILTESFISYQLKLLPYNDLVLIFNLIYDLKIIALIKKIDKNKFSKALLLDKKNKADMPHFVLIKSIGEVFVVDNKYSHVVAPNILASGLDFLFNKLENNNYAVCSN